MGRRVSWTAFEIAYLAYAWVVVSKDPMIGISQKSNNFNTGMFDLFKSMTTITDNPEQM